MVKALAGDTITIDEQTKLPFVQEHRTEVHDDGNMWALANVAPVEVGLVRNVLVIIKVEARKHYLKEKNQAVHLCEVLHLLSDVFK